MSKSTWLHLRFPFSYFLLPVFLFALCLTPDFSGTTALSMFVILHFLLYPASNGYNSYFDKDRQSIGALRNPPPVSRELYWTSLLLDLAAIIWGWMIHWQVALMLLIYGLVSKAYSHPGIRLKKYPILGWFTAGIFQGAFTLLMVARALAGESVFWVDQQLWQVNQHVVIGAALSTMLLWGSFPMTQVYQHQEDGERGDLTISRLLGIRGTFMFSAGIFLAANLGFLMFLVKYHTSALAWGFQLAMLPIMGYFLFWLRWVWQNPQAADYSHAMRLNLVSATSLNVFFIVWLLLR